jgi:hypothetical protein
MLSIPKNHRYVNNYSDRHRNRSPEEEVLIVFLIETFPSDEFPEPFDEIEIGGVGGKRYISIRAF